MKFKIIEERDNRIISIQRLSDNKIFSLEDRITLKQDIKKGLCDGYIVKEILEKDRCPTYHNIFGRTPYPAGSLITTHGLIQIENAAHIDINDLQYKINRLECLSILDIIDIFGEKKLKKLTELVKSKQ